MAPPDTELKGWHSHIDGAVALITSGRRRLFRSDTSRQLFLAVRELMVRPARRMAGQLLTSIRPLSTSGCRKHLPVGFTGG
jgi:hypothetical protein